MLPCFTMPFLPGILLTLFVFPAFFDSAIGFIHHGESSRIDMLPEESFLGASRKEIKSLFEPDPDPMFDPSSHSPVEKVPDFARLDSYCHERNLGYCGSQYASNCESKQMERLVIEQKIQVQDLKETVKKLELIVEMLQDMHMPRMGQGNGYESLQSVVSSRPQDADDNISPLTKKRQKEVENQDYVDVEETDKWAASSSLSATDSLDDTDIRQLTSDRTFPHQSGAQYYGGMTVARYKPAWSDHFQFLSAVKVDGEVTCLHILSHERDESLNKYVAVGVNTGRVYVFLSHGDILVDFLTVSSHPVTAMVSFVLWRNETMLLTGHSDGSMHLHKLWETTHGHSHNDVDDCPTLSMEHYKSLDIDYAKASPPDHSIKNLGVGDKSITILEVYKAGKIRYILATNANGEIYVFRENGTFYGAAKSSSQPLAFLRASNSQRLLFLTEHGVASLDLRSLSVQTQSCKGLNASRVVAYSFDASGRSKAYGFTAEREMIYVALSGDTLSFECHVRFKKKLELEEPLVLQGVKGYLLVATIKGVFVYNTTLLVGSSYKNVPVGMPRLLFTASMDEISLSFSSKQIEIGNRPLMACSREKLVVLGFGDGYIGIYKSKLPSQNHLQIASKFWSSPLFIMVVILLGGWHFFAKRRDSLLPARTSVGALFVL